MGAWALAGSWTHSGDVATVDFTGLGAYSDIRVLCRNITTSASGQRALRVSTDNGSTFLSTSGDYVSVGPGGVEGNASEILLIQNSSAAARSGEIELSAFDLTSPKISQRLNRVDGRLTIIPTTSALNAVRVLDSSGGNLTGGSIYVFGKVAPWVLAGSWTYSSPVANVDFTGLAGYTEVRVLIRGISVSVAGFRQVQVSINNGSTFLSTSGDYIAASTVGVESSTTIITMVNASSASALGGEVLFWGWNLTSLKTAQRQNRIDTRTVFIPTANDLDALRVSDFNGGNLTAGNIYIYAR